MACGGREQWHRRATGVRGGTVRAGSPSTSSTGVTRSMRAADRRDSHGGRRHDEDT
ncbi:hypothetical protein FRAHR75_1010006 [Frankia sp. Hr75.2]|nr:hypothetical protein FRAHR75_1010006 [Frankia sp. Hr75.2]